MKTSRRPSWSYAMKAACASSLCKTVTLRRGLRPVRVRKACIGTWEVWQRGPFSVRHAAHLLRRAGFGGTPGEIASYASLGMPAAIDSLIHPQESDLAFADFPPTGDLYGKAALNKTSCSARARLPRPVDRADESRLGDRSKCPASYALNADHHEKNPRMLGVACAVP